jgi:ABC-type amino acid transport system permease subunit
MDVVISIVVLLLALAIALPRTASWALRLVAGAVGGAYVVYFVSELWGLATGHPHPLAIGQPSATMAGLGLLIIGLPMLVFALSGTSLLRHLIQERQRKQRGGSSDPSGPAA